MQQFQVPFQKMDDRFVRGFVDGFLVFGLDDFEQPRTVVVPDQLVDGHQGIGNTVFGENGPRFPPGSGRTSAVYHADAQPRCLGLWQYLLFPNLCSSRKPFQILLAKFLPCWQRSSSNMRSLPAAELKRSPTRTPSAPYSSINWSASGELPSDLDILRYAACPAPGP